MSCIIIADHLDFNCLDPVVNISKLVMMRGEVEIHMFGRENLSARGVRGMISVLDRLCTPQLGGCCQRRMAANPDGGRVKRPNRYRNDGTAVNSNSISCFKVLACASVRG